MVGEQLAHTGGGVRERVLVGRQHLSGGEAADAFEAVEVVAEGVGDGGVVRILVEADVRGDPGQQVVAGEEAAVAREPGGVGLLQVEADVAGCAPGVQIARRRRPARSRSSPGTMSRSGRAGERPGRARGRGVRSGAMCSSGAPAAVSLAVMYENHRSGRA
ncbi:hypothetical protein GCM10011428_84770 [Streptomyces violaceus]